MGRSRKASCCWVDTGGWLAIWITCLKWILVRNWLFLIFFWLFVKNVSLAALSWTLPAVGYGIIPYGYFIFISILVVHRIWRDEEKCKAKYGKGYDEYCKRVPYRLIPFVFWIKTKYPETKVCRWQGALFICILFRHYSTHPSQIRGLPCPSIHWILSSKERTKIKWKDRQDMMSHTYSRRRRLSRHIFIVLFNNLKQRKNNMVCLQNKTFYLLFWGSRLENFLIFKPDWLALLIDYKTPQRVPDWFVTKTCVIL